MSSLPDSAFQQFPFSLLPQSHNPCKIQNFGHTSKQKIEKTFVPSMRMSWPVKIEAVHQKNSGISKAQSCIQEMAEAPGAPLQRTHPSLLFGRPAGHKHQAESCSLPTPINQWWYLPLKEHFPLLWHLLPSLQQQEQLPCSYNQQESQKPARNPIGNG